MFAKKCYLKLIVQLIFVFALIVSTNLLCVNGANASINQINTTGKNDLFRKIEEPLNLDRITTSWHSARQQNFLTEDRLQKLSVRLRDIARYLGSSSPVTVKIIKYASGSGEKSSDSQADLIISDIRDERGKWVSLSVGQALKLVSKQRSIIHNHDSQKTQDFLSFDRQVNVYHPLLEFPLDRYCAALLYQIFPSQN
jgi:hypothetical protein